MSVELRPVDEDGRAEAAALGRLAFGIPAPAPGSPEPPQPIRRAWGAYEDGVLVAKVALHDYEQWWGGRRVPMGGLSGVAAQPVSRGGGLVGRLIEELALPAMAESGQVVSALYPTAPGIYRSRGWELAGELQDSVVPLHLLAGLDLPDDVQLRAGQVGDAEAVGRAYDALGAVTDGLLTRTGPSFPTGPAGVLEAEVVTVAEVAGAIHGYVAYDRRADEGIAAQLRVRELVAPSVSVRLALLASLAGWSSVVDAVQWRGDLSDVGLLSGRNLPAPYASTGWMLRINDVAGAVAARGWPAVEARVSFAVQGRGPVAGWELQVSGGAGTAERVDPDGLPELHVRGLARLFAGAGDSRQLLRAGLLSRPAPDLDAVFGGPGAQLLDFF